ERRAEAEANEEERGRDPADARPRQDPRRGHRRSDPLVSGGRVLAVEHLVGFEAAREVRHVAGAGATEEVTAGADVEGCAERGPLPGGVRGWRRGKRSSS